MKWRLFSVSLSVNMAMPPMPEFSSSDVSVELNVSVHKTHYDTVFSYRPVQKRPRKQAARILVLHK